MDGNGTVERRTRVLLEQENPAFKEAAFIAISNIKAESELVE